MPEPWTATITAMPVSSNERTRVFPAAPGPHPALAVPQSSCSASGSADERKLRFRMVMRWPAYGERWQQSQFSFVARTGDAPNADSVLEVCPDAVLMRGGHISHSGAKLLQLSMVLNGATGQRLREVEPTVYRPPR